MTKKMKWLLGVFLVAGVALAATATFVPFEHVDRSGSAFPVWLASGEYVGLEKRAVLVNKNSKLTAMIGAQIDYQFPLLKPGYSDHLQLKTLTMSGVLVGDPCLATIGSPVPLDGGPAVPYGLIVNAMVIDAGVADIQISNVAGDGGSYTLPDSGFYVRCFSSQ